MNRLSKKIITSLVLVAIGHLNAGILSFNAYGLDFSIEKLQRTPNTYAIMAETQSGPLCIGHING